MNSNKKNRGFSDKTKIVLFLTIVFIVLFGLLLFFHYYHLFQAREVLSSAKTVRLSIKANAYDYYGIDQTIENPCNKDGLTKGAEKKILNLASCDGDILYVDFDTNKMELKEFVYSEDKYYTVYSNIDGEVSWDVYRSDQMLHY